MKNDHDDIDALSLNLVSAVFVHGLRYLASHACRYNFKSFFKNDKNIVSEIEIP